MILATIPVRTVSITNVREHWRKRADRARQQRATARLVLGNAGSRPELPVVVELTRVAPRPLDDDNLRGSLKSVRDGIAEWLDVDDADPRVRWAYAQRKGEPKCYVVEVGIARTHLPEHCA